MNKMTTTEIKSHLTAAGLDPREWNVRELTARVNGFVADQAADEQGMGGPGESLDGGTFFEWLAEAEEISDATSAALWDRCDAGEFSHLTIWAAA